MPKLPVTVVTLREESLSDGAEYLAQLVSRHQVAIYPQVIGAVSAILVKPGDAVKQGDPLLQIDPRRDAATLGQLSAQRAQKAANVALAKSIEERSLKLLHEGLEGQAQYDQDKSALVAAQQDLAAQDAAIQAQSVQLAYYKILAPFDGTVGDIPVKLGDMVGGQTKLTSVADNASLEAYVNLPVEKLPLVGAASRIDLLDAAGQSVASASIAFVAPEANPNVQSVLVKGVVANKGLLRAGQLVRARLVFSAHPGVRIPLAAVMRLAGQYFVYQVDASSVVHQHPVDLGTLDDNRYDVLKGLVPGDRIAIDQIQKLREGSPIVPMAPSASTSASSAAPPPSASASASAN